MPLWTSTLYEAPFGGKRKKKDFPYRVKNLGHGRKGDPAGRLNVALAPRSNTVKKSGERSAAETVPLSPEGKPAAHPAESHHLKGVFHEIPDGGKDGAVGGGYYCLAGGIGELGCEEKA